MSNGQDHAAPTGLAWLKSSYSTDQGGNCVEVAVSPGTIHVRDSKVESGPTLAFASEAWTAFVTYAAAHLAP